MEKDFVKSKIEKKEFDNGGAILKVGIPMEELQRIEKNGWVNFDIKTSKEGKYYAEVYHPKEKIDLNKHF